VASLISNCLTIFASQGLRSAPRGSYRKLWPVKMWLNM